MKGAIFGSRVLNGIEVERLIEDFIKSHDITEIITAGEIHGVCEIARNISATLQIPLKMHFPIRKYGQGKYEKRSIAIMDDSEIALVIHDGYSRGTFNELKLLKKRGMKHDYHVVNNRVKKLDDGIEPDDMFQKI